MSGLHGVLVAACHWIEYAGLLGGIGSFVVRRLARNRPRIEWADPPLHVALGLALAGGVGLLALGPFGAALAARVAAEAVALFLCVRGRRYVAPFAALAAALLPLSGHAAALQQAAGAELAEALHVLSAGMWAGGILALATLRPPRGWRDAEAGDLLDRFARVAAIAFGVTALTGVLRATEELNLLSSDLWTTTYGLVLLLKSAGVVLMLATSLAWRAGLPAARADGAAAFLVLAATSILATLPAPTPGLPVIELVQH